MSARAVLPALAALLSTTIAVPAMAANSTQPAIPGTYAVLRGAVQFQSATTLPDNAVMTVTLVDITTPGNPVPLVRTDFPALNAASLVFDLPYDPASIKPAHSYGVSARITADDRILLDSGDPQPVLAGGTDHPVVWVHGVATDAGSASDGVTGVWQLSVLNGEAVGAGTAITLGADGAVSGSTGCNRVMGKAAITGDSVRFGPLMTTRMACAPAAMKREQAFLTAMDATRFWRVNGPELVLSDATRRPVLIFRKS
ncbi:hypothetical protein AA103196_2128 [Ameyamaea chiangmaiensis NBRC 103196]|nr:hypothetical protein AA103196_2128 [Ameyamaea chiangmaiensis NBRC 103196]